MTPEQLAALMAWVEARITYDIARAIYTMSSEGDELMAAERALAVAFERDGGKPTTSVKHDDIAKGQVVACIVTPRTDHAWPMFYGRTDGTIVANLVGYRITPLSDEEMRALGYGQAGDRV